MEAPVIPATDGAWHALQGRECDAQRLTGCGPVDYKSVIFDERLAVALIACSIVAASAGREPTTSQPRVSESAASRTLDNKVVIRESEFGQCRTRRMYPCSPHSQHQRIAASGDSVCVVCDAMPMNIQFILREVRDYESTRPSNRIELRHGASHARQRTNSRHFPDPR